MFPQSRNQWAVCLAFAGNFTIAEGQIHAFVRRVLRICILFVSFTVCAEVTAAEKAESIMANLPPPEKGVSDLKFSEFFVNPVGPEGLKTTPKLESLNGKRVRVLGYVVRRDTNSPGAFLMTAMPTELHEEHYGLADDLPAATLFVSDPAHRIAYGRRVMGLVVVSGILEVGNHEEAGGRISAVRLKLDREPTEMQPAIPAKQRKAEKAKAQKVSRSSTP